VSAGTGYDRDDVERFFASYGAALGAGDLDALDVSHDFPTLIVGDERSTILAGPEDVLDATALTGVRAPAGSGAVAVVPLVVGVDAPSDALLWVTVRWVARDENASEVASRTVRYVLRRRREVFEVCAVLPEG
jgi:hypothetical protein